MLKKTKLNSKALYLVLCILSAFCLWVYVSYVENPDMTRWVKGIPVSVVNESKLNENGLAVKSMSSTKVDLKIKAKRSMFTDLTPENIKATLDVSSVTRLGENSLTASVTFPSSAGAVTITDRRKMDIKITTDEYMETELEIIPSITKDPPEGYYVNSVLLDKTEDNDLFLTASGCKSDIENIHHISTNPIDLSASVISINEQLTFTAVNEDLKEISNVKLSVDSSNAFFEIYKTASVRILLDVSHDDPELIYEMNPTQIEITGPAEVVDTVQSIRVGPVNENRFSSGGKTSFNIPIPLQTVLCEGEPSVVEISFKELGE